MPCCGQALNPTQENKVESTESTHERTSVRLGNGLVRQYDTLEEAEGNVVLWGGEVLGPVGGEKPAVNADGTLMTAAERKAAKKAAEDQAKADEEAAKAAANSGT
jgi:hypothetical protein